jgi:hypothetical protein
LAPRHGTALPAVACGAVGFLTFCAAAALDAAMAAKLSAHIKSLAGRDGILASARWAAISQQ